MLRLYVLFGEYIIEETVLDRKGQSIDQLANKLRRFTDRAAPRIAYQFASERMTMLQYGKNSIVTGEISILLEEQMVSSIRKEVDFDGGGCTTDKLTELEYSIQQWILYELAFAVLFLGRNYEIEGGEQF